MKRLLGRKKFIVTRNYVLYKYLKPNGSYDLDEYRRIQIDVNKRKTGHVWVREENIEYLAQYIKQHLGNPKYGLCHGTRSGFEQLWFRKYLAGCEVIGTEISDTANLYPHTIQWDFHDVKDEWINAMDFIYSNSLDHSYDPEKCLNAWMSCIRANGICILEHSTLHESFAASKSDPFGADLVHMPYLITSWGKGKYCLREILPAPKKKANVKSLHFLIIHKF